jgi:hypothetical protein
MDRAQACRGVPIQLAARGERRSQWASFRVAGWAPMAGSVLLLVVPAPQRSRQLGITEKLNRLPGSLFKSSRTDRLATNRAIDGCCNC